MTVNTEDLTTRVVRGAEYLDTRYPGWYAEIDLETLDLDSMSSCIIGQLSQVHHETPYTPGYDPNLGFDLNRDEYLSGSVSRQEAWDALNQLWTDEVEARRFLNSFV